MILRYSTWAIGKKQLELQQRAVQRELSHLIRAEGLINLDVRERLIEELSILLEQGKAMIQEWEEQKVWEPSWWDKIKIWMYEWATRERFAEYREDDNRGPKRRIA